MKKHLLLSFLLICITKLQAQDLKTYSGDMQDAILDNGKASYTYYEKDGEMVRHGKFSYSWKDQQTIEVRDKKINVLLSKSISGNYSDGLKDGTWTYTVKYVDYALNDNHDANVSSDATYSTGSVSMTANYKKGVPHGNWSYNRNFKTRYAIPVGYYSWKWSSSTAVRNISLKASFKDGVLVGEFTYDHPFLKESSKFTLNDEGVLIGNGEYVNLGSKTELIFDKGICVKEVQKDISSGSIKVKKDLEGKLSDSTFEYTLHTTDINHYLDDLLDLFRQNRFFNYSRILDNRVELIGGDYFKSKRVNGGIFYDVFECTSFDQCEATGWVRQPAGHWLRYGGTNYFELYENALEKNEFDEALKNLEIVKGFLGENSSVCKDDRIENLKKVEDLIQKVTNAKTAFYAERAKNLTFNQKYFSSNYLDSLFGHNYAIIDRIVPENQRENFKSFMTFYSKLGRASNGDDEFKNIKILNEKITHPFDNKEENEYTRVNMGSNGSGSYIYKNMFAYQYIWHKLNKDGYEFDGSIPKEAWEWLNTITIGELRYLVHYMTVETYSNSLKFCYTSRAKDEICIVELDNCKCYTGVKESDKGTDVTIKTIEEKDLELLSPKLSTSALTNIQKNAEGLKVEPKTMFVDMFSEHKDNFKSSENLKPKFKELDGFIQLTIEKFPEILSTENGITKLFDLSDALRSIQSLDEKLVKAEIDKTLKKLSTFEEKTELVLKYK